MPRRAYLRCIAALFLMILSGATPALAQRKSDEQRVDSIFAAYAAAGSPGCALAATRPGARVERAYGLADVERGVPITLQTIFEAGSVSKQFTAAAVVLLAQRGKLSLDDDVRKYLPEVPAFGGRRITIRQLLNHVSGLRDWGVVAGLQGWPRGTRAYTNAHVLDMVARQSRLNFGPGAEWMYSNTNYNLAAILVQRVSGSTLAEFTRRELFLPLGMTHSSWRDDYTRVVPGRALAYEGARETLRTAMPNENAYGNGGLLTTVGDLLLWNEELSGGRVLGRALGQELEREGVLADGRGDGYGLGLFLGSYRGEREVWHDGATGGYRAVLMRLPERGISLAVLCNAGSAGPARLGLAVADVLLSDVAVKAAPEPAATGQPKPQRVALQKAELERLAGIYRDRGSAQPLSFQAGDGVLRTRSGVLEPVSPAEFHSPRGDVVIFRPAPGGGRGTALRIVGRDTMVLDPVGPADPLRLADYAGAWHSPEAEATWLVEVEDGKLVARQRPDLRVELVPAYADAFLGPGGSVWVFDRNAAGKVNGLGVWVARARDNRFMRR